MKAKKSIATICCFVALFGWSLVNNSSALRAGTTQTSTGTFSGSGGTGTGTDDGFDDDIMRYLRIDLDPTELKCPGVIKEYWKVGYIICTVYDYSSLFYNYQSGPIPANGDFDFARYIPDTKIDLRAGRMSIHGRMGRRITRIHARQFACSQFVNKAI